MLAPLATCCLLPEPLQLELGPLSWPFQAFQEPKASAPATAPAGGSQPALGDPQAFAPNPARHSAMPCPALLLPKLDPPGAVPTRLFSFFLSCTAQTSSPSAYFNSTSREVTTSNPSADLSHLLGPWQAMRKCCCCIPRYLRLCLLTIVLSVPGGGPFPTGQITPVKRLMLNYREHRISSKVLCSQEVPCSMLASSRDGFRLPVWRSNRLSPKEEQELELDHSDLGFMGELWNKHPPWAGALVSKIRTMEVMEQSLALQTICRCLDEYSQNPEKQQVSNMDSALPKLLDLLGLDPKKAEERGVLFCLYGLILCECVSSEQVERHLACLLELSHQPSSQREGIALAVGLASTKHLKEVWALLEHLGRTRFLRAVFTSPEPHQDDVLKSSFLLSAILLTRALRRESGAQSYKFTQIPELIQCLLCMLQKEPNFLASLFQQKIMLVILALSNLRPSLKPMVKSKVLQTCLRSLYLLPPTESLRSILPPLEPVPDVMMLYKKTEHALDLLLQNFVSENPSMDEVCFLLQHMEPWLKSEKSHERKRAVQSIFLLLQHVVDKLKLAEEAMPSVLGHQIGLLTLLWQDKDETTRCHAHQCVFLLLQLVVQQKGMLVESTRWNKIRNLDTRASKELEMKLYHTVKAFEEDLTVAQHTQLVLTLLHSLCSCSHLRCDLACKLLQLIFSEPSIRPEQVAEILHSLFQELPSIQFKSIQQTMMKAITDLGTQHTQEVVEVIMSLCHPSERRLLPLWKALAAHRRLAQKVITLLYMKLKLRPSRELIRPPQQSQLISLLALGTIYELLYTQEYRDTIRWAFAGILLGLLTQLHYLFELGMVEGISDYQEDILDAKPLGPCRTCLEALKGLFWTTQYWEVFAHVKLLDGWKLFEHLETYTEGVTLLARAMAHYDCEIKAVLGQAVIFLKNTEERDNIIAILILTEFLNSPKVAQHMSRKVVSNSLNQGLRNPNKLVQAMSLNGLSSILVHPKKATLLQNHLMGLLDSFLQPKPTDLLGLMEILGDLMHRLSVQVVGAISLKIAQHLLPLFEDERAEVRGGAIFLFGNVIHNGGKKFQQALKTLTSQALVPLLFHLADSCPKVIMKAKFTFLRCAILMKWEFQKEVFSKLAWGQGLGAENDIFIYMVESNFGSYQRFLMQAFTYLGSPHTTLKLAAMKFIGGMLQDYFTELCFCLKKDDMKILKKQLENLSNDPDSTCRRFYHKSLEDIMELSYYVT
ncbi:maestro heat-like repeat family member 5 [Castor canadensis]|uniref:Maestro heat-like repeat family member 5 n=1 Tax=Castor canadensis TaxID=51338 RepID=A0AC58M151_CASCN